MKEDMRQILDRFYQGETTIDEERRLIAMLLSDDCPMDLKAERHAVIMLARQEAISVPDDLGKRVLGVIKPQAININWYKWFAAAAVALLLVGVALWTYLPKPEPSAIPQTSAKAEPRMSTIRAFTFSFPSVASFCSARLAESILVTDARSYIVSGVAAGLSSFGVPSG